MVVFQRTLLSFNDSNHYFRVHEVDEMRDIFCCYFVTTHTSLAVTSMITTQLVSHLPCRDIYISTSLFAVAQRRLSRLFKYILVIESIQRPHTFAKATL